MGVVVVAVQVKVSVPAETAHLLLAVHVEAVEVLLAVPAEVVQVLAAVAVAVGYVQAGMDEVVSESRHALVPFVVVELETSMPVVHNIDHQKLVDVEGVDLVDFDHNIATYLVDDLHIELPTLSN